MTKIFLSYRRVDQAFAGRIYDRLKDRFGADRIFKDVDNIPLGRDFRQVLADEVQACHVVVVAIGPDWLNLKDADGNRRLDTPRDFVRTEIELALERDIPVIPLLLENTAMPAESDLPDSIKSLAYRQAARVRPDPDFDHDIGRLCAAIDSAGAPVPPTSKVSEVCPYRGLEVFQIDDAGVYFGREDVIDLACEKISDFSGSDAIRFLAIIGASGSGKSSLAYAGILARLTQGSTSDWPIVVCRPGHNPVEELAIALRAESRTATAAGDVGELIDKFSNDQRRLHLVSRLALEGRPAEERLVLLIDQFEELFRPGDIDIKKAFIGNLLHAAKAPDGKTIVLLTMRADFYAKASVYPDLANVLATNQVLVGPMSEDQIRAAIEKPAQLSGARFESGLVDLIVQDMKTEAGALPFLQDALTQLWNRQTDGLLTVADYKEIGRLEGAIENRANEFYASLSDEEQEECQRLLLRLTQPGEGTEDTKRRVRRADLAGTSEVENIIQKLAKARLITTESEGESDRETAYVEVSHEALIRGWSQLRKWIDADRDALRFQHQITTDAAVWQRNQDDAFLYRGARLGIAEDWLQTHADSLTETELEFVNASRALRDREELQRVNAAKRLKRLALSAGSAAVAATILAIAASFLAVAFDRARKDEQQQTRIVIAQRLATEAEELADEDLGEAVTRAADAVRTVFANKVIEESDSRHPLDALDAVLSDRDRKDKLLALTPRPTLLKPVLSPANHWLVAQSYDRSTYLWNLTNDKPSRQRLFSPGGTVSSVTFSEDDNWLVQVGAGGKLRIHDLRTNRSVDLPSDEASVRICRFDANGRWLMTADFEAIRLWDLSARDLFASPSPTKVFRDLEPYSRQVGGFSPDGKWFVMSDSEGVHLWRLAELTSKSQGKLITSSAGLLLLRSEEYRLTTYRGESFYELALSDDYELAFSPDGRWLPITNTEQEQTRLIDLNSDEPNDVNVPGAIGSAEVGLYVSFDAASRRFAVSDGRNSIHVFTIIAPSVASVESSATSVESTAVLRPGATRFRFANEDWLLTTPRYTNTTYAWFLKNTRRPPIDFRVSAAPLISSPDGRWIVGTSSDGVRRAYDLAQEIPDKAPFSMLQNFSSNNLCFTPNNHWLAVAETESLFLWDLSEQSPFSNLIRVATEFSSSDAVQGILATRSGSQIIVVGDWSVRIFQCGEKNEWEHIHSLEGARSDTESHSVGKNYNFLVCRGEHATELVNLGDDLSTQRVLTLCNDKATHVEVCPNGGWVAAATETGTVYATNLDEFQPACIAENLGKVTAMASSANGAYLFVASSDNRIHLWGTSGFKKQIVIDDHHAEVFTVASDPDSKWLVSRSYDGTGFLRRLEDPHTIVAELKDGQWIRTSDSSIIDSDYVQADDWTNSLWNSLLRSVEKSKKYTIAQQVQIEDLIGYTVDQARSADAKDLPRILSPSNHTGVLADRPLLPEMVVRAGYSPSGDRLVFSKPDGLFTSSADGGDRQQLLRFGKDPVWEPKVGSTQIAFVAGRYATGEEIWVVESNAEKATYLADGGWPTWSNDGRLFYHNRHESTLRCIDMQQSPPTNKELMPMGHWYPSVSHDGNYVSHMSARANVWLEPASILCITDLNSGATVHKFPFYGIDGILSSWSPDGNLVAVGTYARGNDAAGIWIVNVTDMKAAQLAKGAFRRTMWAPDGKSLIFDSDAGLWSLSLEHLSEWLDPDQVLKTMFEDYAAYLTEDESRTASQPDEESINDKPTARARRNISRNVSILFSFAFGLLDHGFSDESLDALQLVEQEVTKFADNRPDVVARYYSLVAAALEKKAQAIDQFPTIDECKKKASSALRRAREIGLITSTAAEKDPYLKSLLSEEEYRTLAAEYLASKVVAGFALENSFDLTIIAENESRVVSDRLELPDDFSIIGLRTKREDSNIVPPLKEILQLWSLEVLDLSRCDIKDSDLQELSALQNLRELRLAGTEISNEGLKHLNSLTKLDTLNLENTRITDEGLKHLLALQNMWFLNLSNTGISNEGVETIAKFKKLRELEIRGTKVSDDGIFHLETLPDLLQIDARGSAVSFEGANNLAKSIMLTRGDHLPVEFTANLEPRGSTLPLDLSTWSNRKLEEPANEKGSLARKLRNNFEGLPKGQTSFLGIPFLIGDSYVSTRNARDIDEAKSLELNRTVNGLFFLHATEFGYNVPDGTPIGAYELTYDDEESIRIPLIIGDNIRDWWDYPHNRVASRATSNAYVAWRSANEYSRNWDESGERDGASLRLYVYAWTNPKPTKKLRNITLHAYEVLTRSNETVRFPRQIIRKSSPTPLPFCLAVTADLFESD